MESNLKKITSLIFQKLEPKVLVDAIEVSVKTLGVMGSSIKNLKKRIASKPINFKKYLSIED